MFEQKDTMTVPILKLKAGHVLPVWAGHPWVYAQALERSKSTPAAGAEVVLVDAKGNQLGRGLYSPKSAIAVRLHGGPDVSLDAGLIASRIAAADVLRAELGLVSGDNPGYRAVYAEGDALPGLVVDRLGDCLSVQFGTAGMKQRQAQVITALLEQYSPKVILDLTPPIAAKLEGFEIGERVLHGELSDVQRFEELGIRYEIPSSLQQKTGFYFDQRPLRERLMQLSQGRRVLDTYCYTGSLGIAAARGGASRVLAIEKNAEVVKAGKHCAHLNECDDRMEFRAGDAADALAEAANNPYDIVICDPPKLAPQRKHKRVGLGKLRGIAKSGAKATRDGGLLVLSCCSGTIDIDDLTRAMALGTRDAGYTAIVRERLFQGADHPVSAAFREGLYLKTLIVQLRRI